MTMIIRILFLVIVFNSAGFVAQAQNKALPLELGPGVSNFGGEYALAAAHLDRNIVILSGLVKPGSEVIAFLPATMRPAARLIFAVATQNGTARVDVLPDGRILVINGGNTSWISLSGISFATG